MRKKILLSAIVTIISLATLTGCGSKLTANSLTLELGSPVPDDILEYVTVSDGDSEDILANATLSTEDIDNMTVGRYTATVTYGKRKINVTVDVVDTVAPVLEENDESFSVGDVITVDDLVTIDDFNDVTGVFIDKDGNEQDTITIEEDMTITVRATDASDNFSELTVSPNITNIAELYGTWAATFDLSEEMASQMEGELEGFHEKFDITVMIDFNEDGTYKMYADEVALTDTFNTWLESLAAFSAEIVYKQLTADGYTRKEINSFFARDYGMGFEEYMLSELQSNFNIEELIDSLESTGVYDIKGNKFYISETAISPYQYDLFTLEGDVLTINADEDAISVEMIEGFTYPFVFNRVQ
ncbi:MAG: hypothetical protein HDR00_12860 [Lachnospiraceae bacterium]|nr:hypothetical protein [Lachnospiraceae bacterium]